MDRAYKRYKSDPKASIPGRSHRRLRKKRRDLILGEGVSASRSAAIPPATSSCINPSDYDRGRGVILGCRDDVLIIPASSDSDIQSSAGSELRHSFSSALALESSDDLSSDDTSNIECVGLSQHCSDSSTCPELTEGADEFNGNSVDSCRANDSGSDSDVSSVILDDVCGTLSFHEEDSGGGSFDSVFSTRAPCQPAVNVQVENHFVEMQEKLCGCSNVTQGEAFLSVLSLGLRHSLSYKAMVDILSLINVIFQRDVIPASFHHLLKHAEKNRVHEQVHPICEHCGNCVDELPDNSEILCECGNVVPPPSAAKKFVLTLGMKEQLKQLFESSDIAEALNYRFEREVSDDTLEDVYDGALYKHMSSEGLPLSSKHNFSFAFNTDGVPLGKSSSQQLWPIYITINELPPKLRSRHMLLVGLWVASHEPNMLAVLQPFVKEANTLAQCGVDWNRNGVMINSKIIPLFSVVDTQARWRMLNHKCFSGYYGCTFCEHPGKYSKRGLRYGMQVSVPPDRTDSSLRAHMIEGYMRRNYPKKKRHFKGSRGPSVLMNLSYFNLADGFVPDSMHVLKGVVHQNLDFILKKLDEDEIYQISERILALHPPSQLTRLPRGLEDLKKLKANELRALLVLYGPVVMLGIVESKYLSHFCLLSAAMYLLMQRSISHAQLEYAGKLLVVYVSVYEKYYGLEGMTYNVHQLLHVVKGVINLGPIYTHTCYPYEGKNRYLLQLAKSPLEVAKGVAKRYAIYNNLPQLCERFNVSDEILNYCNKMFFRPLRSSVRADDAVLLGRGSPYCLLPEENAALTEQLGLSQEGDPGTILQFERIILDGIRFTTAAYNANFRRDDSAMYHTRHTSKHWSRITNIVLLRGEDVILFARELMESPETPWRVDSFRLNHIRQIRCEGQLLALRPSEVGGQCMFMTTAKGVFAVRVPYGCRGD